MIKIFENHKINISPEIVKKLERYMELLLSWNEKVNLTAITDHRQIWIKHFLDSLIVMKFEELGGKKIIDIGTGAGFPGLALKIADSELDITLLDSLAKRLDFLEEVIGELELDKTNIRTYHARAEDGAKDPALREQFDIAVSRAVAGMNVLCEYSLPYVKVGGLFIAYKSREYAEELEEAKAAIKTLGAEIDRVEEFELDYDNPRTLIFIRKLSQTPSNYPRKPHIIAKRPIM